MHGTDPVDDRIASRAILRVMSPPGTTITSGAVTSAKEVSATTFSAVSSAMGPRSAATKVTSAPGRLPSTA
jgi:hypothetical protein